MAMDKQQDTPQEDLVCVGAQCLLRLRNELWDVMRDITWMDYLERNYRLTAIHSELHKIICEARPCGHAEHLAHVPPRDGRLDRLVEAINALYMDGVIERRPVLSPRRGDHHEGGL